MPYLIKWRYFPNILPPWYFNFLLFLFLLLLLFLLPLFLFELNPKVGQLQFNHIINHFLDLVFNFREYSLFDFPHFWFIFRAYLIFPFLSMLFNLSLDIKNCLGWTIPWVFLFEFILLSQFFLFLLAFALFFLFGFSHFLHHL